MKRETEELKAFLTEPGAEVMLSQAALLATKAFRAVGTQSRRDGLP